MSLDKHSLHTPLQPWLQSPRWYIGYSGGLDSTVLLHLLGAMARDTGLPPLCALHVNHQLSAEANSWQQQCAAQCNAQGIEFRAELVTVEERGSGLEAAAREARYQVFEKYLGANECVLLAHHRDDQVETFFLRLLRGAGIEGLAAMAAQRPLGQGQLLRPLLSYTRSALESYAAAHKLSWIEDESNRDNSLDRNFLRRQVLPQLAERWPGYRDRIATSTENLRDYAEDLRSEFEPELQLRMAEAFGEQTLSLAGWHGFSELRQRQLLRSWLQKLDQYSPDRKALCEFVRQLRESDDQAHPLLTCASYQLRRYRECLYLSPVNTMPPVNPTFATASGTGIRAELGDELRVIVRQGGERCRPSGRSRSQTVKKLLQEYGVPPWLRESLPLVLNRQDQVVAVANLWVCEGFEAGPGQAGLELVWR